MMRKASVGLEFARHNAVAFVALFIALGGGAYAATNSFVSSNGVIHGCVPKQGGDLVILKPGKSCGSGTRPLTFDASGQPGRPVRRDRKGHRDRRVHRVRKDHRASRGSRVPLGLPGRPRLTAP